MSTVTEICLALKEILETLPGVDKASISEYVPPVETESIALLITPYRQRDLFEVDTANPMLILQSHQIYCEFWVKLDTAAVPATMERAREIGQAAARRLLKENRKATKLNDTVSVIGHYGINSSTPRIEVKVHDRPIRVNNVPFIVADMTVPVIDYADGEV